MLYCQYNVCNAVLNVWGGRGIFHAIYHHTEHFSQAKCLELWMHICPPPPTPQHHRQVVL